MAARADILAYVPADTQDPDLRRLREIAEAPLEWDRVAEITEEPNTDWVYDFDMAPLRTFVCVDTLVVHNSNFEDATVISQSLADRMKSEHAYQHELELTPQHKLGKRDYLGLFPARFEKHHLASLDEKGIVKPGTTVQYGDPLILAAREKPAVPGRVHRTGSPGYSDATITWDHHDPGVVTDAVWGAHGPVVMVKNQAPTRVADKLAGRFGDKSVIAHIVPDEEMPVDSQGRPFEMLANPLGVISRGNPGQMAELWLGKIAAATGKVQKVEDFDDSKDLMEHVRGELARHGLSGTEDLVDPATGRKVPGVATGVRFVMKLHHTAESGLQARGSGGYSAEETPTKGGPAGCFTGPTAVVLADGTAAAPSTSAPAAPRTRRSRRGRWSTGSATGPTPASCGSWNWRTAGGSR
jgi:DNA-directed RNA polymerase beta subunit